MANACSIAAANNACSTTGTGTGTVAAKSCYSLVSQLKRARAGIVVFLLLATGNLRLQFHPLMKRGLAEPGTPELVQHEKEQPWRTTVPILQVEVPAWLEDYAAFHSTSIAQAKLLNETTARDKNNYMIFYCTHREGGSCSGTANQQRAIFAALVVSIVTKRIFLMEMDKPVRLDQVLGPNLIEWNYSLDPRTATDRNMTTERIDHNKLPPVLNAPANFMPQVSSQVIYIRTKEPPELNGLWMSSEVQEFLATYNMATMVPPEQLYKWLFYTLYKPTPLLVHHMHNVTTQLAIPFRTNYVGVHVRTGDTQFQNNTDNYLLGGERPQSFVSCANKLKDSCFLNATITPIVIVTDKQDMRKTLSDMDSSVRYIDTKIVHVDLSTDNDLEGLLNVWSDILLLARATCTVTSFASSYSRLGSEFLGNSKCTAEATRCDVSCPLLMEEEVEEVEESDGSII